MAFPIRNYASDIRNFGAQKDANNTGSSYVFVQPRPRYTFFVYFEIPQEIQPSWYQESIRNGSFLATAVSVGRPAVDYDIETIRSYNGIRHVPTRIKYKAIDAKFHDDSASLIMNLMKEYRKHYHYSGDATDPGDFGDSVINGSSPRRTTLPSIGLKLKTTRCFFSKIIIYDLGTSPDHVNVYHLINPIITTTTHDGLDYYDSSGMSSITLNIEYEGYFDEIGVNVASKEDALIQLGEQATDHSSTNTQDGGFTSDNIFGSFVDGIIGRSGISSEGISNALFQSLKSGTLALGGSLDPMNVIRLAVRQLNSGLEREVSTLAGNATRSLVDGIAGQLPFQSEVVMNPLRSIATRSVRKLMTDTFIGNDSWIDKVGGG